MVNMAISNDDNNNDGDENILLAKVAANIAAKATGLPKRTKEYIRKALRPNIYIGVHYNAIYEEYRPPTLLNILVEEKYYK